MSLNPFTRLTQRRVEQAGQRVMDEAGWGNLVTFRTRRRDGQTLYFQMRVPDGLEMIEVAKLAQSAHGAPAFVGHAAAALEQARERAGVIVVGGLCAAGDADQEVFATLTVALVELDGPFNVDHFMPQDSPATTHSKQDAVQVSEHTWRIHRLSVEAQGEGREPVPMLMIEYLFVTRYGVLATAFATQRQDMMGDQARDLFADLQKTVFIGEEPAAA